MNQTLTLPPNGKMDDPRPLSRKGDPTWEVAFFFPTQGSWREADYFALDTNRLVELCDGHLEVLPMPTLFHQLIVAYLHRCLNAFLAGWDRGGKAFFAPVPVRLWPEQLREPDVFYISQANLGDLHKTPEKLDLAMEVVSPGTENRERDLEIKRVEYAKAQIPEYWIVDPENRTITILVLDKDVYREHGVFGIGEHATSLLLPGFKVQVDAVWEAGGE